MEDNEREEEKEVNLDDEVEHEGTKDDKGTRRGDNVGGSDGGMREVTRADIVLNHITKQFH